MPITGHCHCAAVTYSLAQDTLPTVYACHCTICQRWSGSAFALHALLPEGALRITGPLTEYSHEHQGQVSNQRCCAVCHTRLFNTTSAAPGLLVLRAGTLTRAVDLVPVAHIWTHSKQTWLALPDGVPSWPHSPTPEQFASALSKR